MDDKISVRATRKYLRTARVTKKKIGDLFDQTSYSHQNFFSNRGEETEARQKVDQAEFSDLAVF
jgi:hypothetical protein